MIYHHLYYRLNLKLTKLPLLSFSSMRIENYMRDKIRLVSSADTGHFYTTSKNKKTATGKLELKKYDPVVRKHVLYKEAKIK